MIWTSRELEILIVGGHDEVRQQRNIPEVV